MRVPVVPPTGECKPFQEVLVELASRLKLPAFTTAERRAQVQGLPRLRRQLRAAAGHRLPDGLARQGRHRAPARRAESEAVGDVREERLRLPAATCRRRCTTCATGTASTSTSPRTRAGGRRTTSSSSRSTATRCRRFASPRRARPRAGSRPSTCASASRPTSTRCRSGTRRSRTRPPTRGLSAQRDHAAADGDVPLLGLAERVAAPDPQPQLPARQPAHRAGGRHRRRRLVLGREPLGPGALHAPLQRGGRAGHGVDLERDRQGRRRLAARARRRRGAQGLPPQPPDHRRAAVRRRPDDQQLRSGHRPGRLVRRARAHRARRAGAARGELAADRGHAGAAGRARRDGRGATYSPGAASHDRLAEGPAARRRRRSSTRRRSAPIAGRRPRSPSSSRSSSTSTSASAATPA